MPETTIGLVPDVGGMWLACQCAPGRFGEYLGLLGERMNAADAIVMGFADTFVSSARLPELVAALVDPAADAARCDNCGFRRSATTARAHQSSGSRR